MRIREEDGVSLDAVLKKIDERAGEHVAALQRVVRQPSISSQNIGVQECAELLVSMMTELGIDARVMETAGRPVVFGEIRTTRPNAPTLRAK